MRDETTTTPSEPAYTPSLGTTSAAQVEVHAAPLTRSPGQDEAPIQSGAPPTIHHIRVGDIARVTTVLGPGSEPGCTQARVEPLGILTDPEWEKVTVEMAFQRVGQLTRDRDRLSASNDALHKAMNDWKESVERHAYLAQQEHTERAEKAKDFAETRMVELAAELDAALADVEAERDKKGALVRAVYADTMATGASAMPAHIVAIPDKDERLKAVLADIAEMRTAARERAEIHRARMLDHTEAMRALADMTAQRDAACAARDAAVKSHREAIAAAEQVTRRMEVERDAAVRNCSLTQSRYDALRFENERVTKERDEWKEAVACASVDIRKERDLRQAAERALAEARADHNQLLRQWSSLVEAAGLSPMLDDADGSRMTEALAIAVKQGRPREPTTHEKMAKPIGAEGPWKPKPNGYDPGARPVTSDPEPFYALDRNTIKPEKAADPHAWAKPGVWAVAEMDDGRIDALRLTRPQAPPSPSHHWHGISSNPERPTETGAYLDFRRPATPEETARFEADLARAACDMRPTCQHEGCEQCFRPKAEPIPLKVGQRWVCLGLDGKERHEDYDDRIVAIGPRDVVTRDHDNEGEVDVWTHEWFRSAHPRLRLPEELEPAPTPEPAHPKQLCSNCKQGLALAVSMLCSRCATEPEEPYMMEATNEPRRAPGSWALVSTRSGWVCGLIERTGDIIDARDGRRYQAIGLRDIGARVCALHVEGGCADPAPAEPKTSLPVLAGHHGSLSAVADPGLPPGRARISQEEP